MGTCVVLDTALRIQKHAHLSSSRRKNTMNAKIAPYLSDFYSRSANRGC